ncbi:hypothetical protein TrST_g13845 [Triparma strigata]|uniref:SET domain-containing protein n=1 Tax=Triparma strigata TaxID=1606541 RepID=A0A9W7BJ94_9STRA|nr:hypothetical protein TrST_g13845 [Triparma strigata]
MSSPPSPKRPRPSPSLETWIKSHGGYIHPSLSLLPSPLGSTGLFTSTPLPPSSKIITVPSSCIITENVARESDIGKACLAQNPNVDSKFILQAFVALGITVPSSTNYEPYFSSLPKTDPTPYSWSPSHLSLLKSTNLLASLLLLKSSLKKSYTTSFPSSYKSLINLPQFELSCSLIRSRSFPGHLINVTGSILLPYLDMANHEHVCPVTWSCSENEVSLVNEGKVVGEVFNNYGGKGGESMLMCYGFCGEEMEGEMYGLEVGVRGEGGVRKMGPYYVRRRGEEQFPKELWKVLDGGGEEEEEEEEEGVSAEAVEMLLETLEKRLEPFEDTRERDDEARAKGSGAGEHEVLFASRYRVGQRLVLEEAVETLKEMLGTVDEYIDDADDVDDKVSENKV